MQCTAQDAGLDFWQTSSDATISYQSVPKERVVKVVSESGTTKSNTQTIMGS